MWEEQLSIARLKETDKAELTNFADFIANQVFFVLAGMPAETDVATYFEIMNNSGDQLRKHEILKARVLESVRDRLTVPEMQSLAKVWDACSQMDIRIQDGLKTTANRTLLFGDNYDSFLPENITRLTGTSSPTDADKPASLADIIHDSSLQPKEEKAKEDEDNADNTGEAIIDFPNFLMHVMRQKYNEEYREKTDNDIPLNEKSLLDVYNKIQDKVDGVEFIAAILYYRIVLDRFVVRTDADKGKKWALKRPRKNKSDNKLRFVNTFGKTYDEDTEDDEPISEREEKVVKALSMLQVSYPQRKYKDYLQKILSWFDGENVTIGLNEYLAKLKGLILRNLEKSETDHKEKLFTLGTGTPRFVLNAIDYLMYLSGQDYDFEFKYLNSVEHHMPQSRITNDEIDTVINSIGNLLLLSRRSNSSYNDNSPLTKVEKTQDPIDTLPPNRCTIYQRTIDNRGWGTDDIKQHTEEIRNLLNNKRALLGAD